MNLNYILPILLFFFSTSVLAQNIVGQAIFTPSQLRELNNRIDNQSTEYWSNGNGYYGDGLALFNGAETFLTQERGTGFYANEFDWFSYPYSLNQNMEPRPGANPSKGSGYSNDRSIENIHDAAVLSIVWKGRSDIVSFAGVTQSKDLHSKDLAENIMDVLVRRASDPELDWKNRNKFKSNGGPAYNPMFMLYAKMGKYLNSYACIYQQLPNNAQFSLVETWFKDSVDYGYEIMGNLFQNVMGQANRYPPLADKSVLLPSQGISPNVIYTAKNFQPYTWYDNNNNGYNSISYLQAILLNNRVWDTVSMIGSYGIMFNNSPYRDYEKNMIHFYLEVGVFPDNTLNEWYRSYSTIPEQGISYAYTTLWHIVSGGLKHAVAVHNGLPNVGTDLGEILDYTTSRGTNEIFSTNNYVGTSTSGGSKSIEGMLVNISKYFRTAANGGWSDVRYAQNTNRIRFEKKPIGPLFAFANTYYDNPIFKDFYKGLNGFPSPNYYNANPLTDSNPSGFSSNGSWGEYSYGPWGIASSHGRMLGFGNMEGKIFTDKYLSLCC